MRRLKLLSCAALGLLVLSVIGGCASAERSAKAGDGEGQAEHLHGTTLPDNMASTASFGELPAFLDHYTDTTRGFYSQIHAHEDMLKQLNCYCGCMEYYDPHDSLYRCFVIGASENEVQWTDHGASCGICLMELRDAIRLADEGKTMNEIRQHIDSTYGGV